MTTSIQLGFEVGTGKPVEIPLRHMVVAGQTQEAGKTTTMEALISRGRLPAVAFVTKRGEKSFESGRRVDPYFRERADWQFVSSVLEATMREKLKFERSWIIAASKGAKTLSDVQRNVRELLMTARGLSEGVFTTLDAYLEIVVPRLAKVRFAKKLDIRPGVNVLDLADRNNFPHELQSLVMRSCLEWVYEQEENTIVIIPEAWEFIPQSRGSPVKLAAIELLRKGAGLGNYVWLDSQDIGGIDKEVLRQVPVWLLGVQRETNEIKRTLSNIPAGISRPSPADIAHLEKGQFFACWGRHVIKVYVWPAWMSQTDAQRVSMGREIGHIPLRRIVAPTPQPEREDTVTESEANELREENERLSQRVKDLEKQIHAKPRPRNMREAMDAVGTEKNGHADTEGLYSQILARLLKEPAILELRKSKPELNVTVVRKTVTCDESTAQGMIAILLSEGFFDNVIGATPVHKELKRRWNYGGIAARAYEQLDRLTEMGFVTKEEVGYQAVPDMKVNIQKVS